jgi:hypothetical protein
MGLPQHPDEHRPERPVLLAVDQELGEGAALWVTPELSDPVCPLEVGEHEDMEELGTRSGTQGLQAFAKPALTLVGSHDRRLRGRTGVTRPCAVYWPQPTGRSPALLRRRWGRGRRQRARGLYRLGTRRRPVLIRPSVPFACPEHNQDDRAEGNKRDEPPPPGLPGVV